MILRRRKAEKRRQRIVGELVDLLCDPELYLASQYIGDIIMYAAIGKNRLSLSDDYVARTRATALELVERKYVLSGMDLP